MHFYLLYLQEHLSQILYLYYKCKAFKGEEKYSEYPYKSGKQIAGIYIKRDELLVKEESVTKNSRKVSGTKHNVSKG